MHFKNQVSTPLILIVLLCLLFFAGCPSGGGGGGGGGGDDSAETYTISGTMSATDNSAIDSDVNDANAPYTANDDIDHTQVLPNPVVLGGYVNVAGAGEAGRSKTIGDQNDFFKATLTPNQTITLYIGDHQGNPFSIDLDLYLYDANKDLFDSSEELDAAESVDAGSAGDYYIEVRAVSGASNYILSIGQPVAEVTIFDPQLNEEFVPGDVIIAFKDDASPSGDEARSLYREPVRGLTLRAGAQQPIRLYQFNLESKAQVFESLHIGDAGRNRQLFQAVDDETQLKLDTLRVIKELNKRADVLYAEPNYIRRALLTPNDTYYSRQWHYPLINLPQAWEITQGDSNVIVAVVDTGILASHPDIQGQLTSDGYDFISSTAISNDGDGIDADPEDPGDEMQGGSSFHGTHVAGTIAAATNNSKGVAGVAKNVKIMALRVLGLGGGSSYDIMQSLRYAARLTNDSGTIPSKKADIINMSLGGGSSSQSEQNTINSVRQEGVIIIAAAGNESTNTLSYPAGYTGVVSVSAVDAEKQLAPYSNYGSSIHVAAPGGDISKDTDSDGYGDGVLSTSGDDAAGDIQYVYSFYNGTSMACPHMAGVVALMKSVRPDLTPDQFDAFLSNGLITEDIGSSGFDNQFGWGLIDAFKAVTTASSSVPSALIINPTSLNFKEDATSITITAENLGSEANLIIQTVTDDADWLDINDTDTDPITGLGTYAATADRDGLLDGPYYATVTFEYAVDTDPKTAEIPVSMYKDDIIVPGDAGFHYILLLDGETFSTVDYAAMSATDGQYEFSFSDVPEGSYILFAGSDSDNDYYIGDSGESMGAYISIDQPVVVEVDADLSGLDFITSFRLNLTAELYGDGADAILPLPRKY